MEAEDSDFSSNDSELEFCQALRTPCYALPFRATPVSNKFQVLEDESADSDVKPEHLLALNSWAHKVTVKATPKKSSLKKTKDRKAVSKVDFNIETVRDLDVALDKNEVLRQRLPGISADTMPLYAAMAKKAPPPDTLQEGEVWAMIDSGSGVDGMDIDSVCPGAKVVKATNPITCITANGEEMIADEVAHLSVELDGQGCNIPFSKLPLSMPIISVRRHIHRGHRCRIQENGGYFRNTANRKKSRFIEKDGVYFMRLKVTGNCDEPPPSSPFGRRGAP